MRMAAKYPEQVLECAEEPATYNSNSREARPMHEKLDNCCRKIPSRVFVPVDTSLRRVST